MEKSVLSGDIIFSVCLVFLHLLKKVILDLGGIS
jgi:hypothetical protein